MQVPTGPELLDLNYLTLRERKHLQSVIDADDQLRIRSKGILRGGTTTSKSKYRWTSRHKMKIAAFQQLQVELETDHSHCSELLRNSLIAAGVSISREDEQKILKEQFGSTSSLYDYKGDYDITGDVLVGVYYRNSELHIHVNRARGLAAADTNGYSDPYVKTYLLPDKDKHTKHKTSVIKKTLDPVYDETLKYKYSEFDLRSRTIWLSVWDWHRFSTNLFLGEIHLPLSSLDLTDTTDHWYKLQDKDIVSQQTHEPSHAIIKPPVDSEKNIYEPSSLQMASTTSEPPVSNIVPGTERPHSGKPASTTSPAASKSIAVHTQPLETPGEPKIYVQSYHNSPQHSPLARLKRTDTSSLTGSASLDGSMASIYSGAGGKGDYDITGEVLVGVFYKDSHLHIHIERARGLAAANSNGCSNPYVKTYLLPDVTKQTKQKTAIKKKTLDPVYNETLSYKLSLSELRYRTLLLSVWDWDRFDRNQFLGEVRLPLSSVDISLSSGQWYRLQDMDETTCDEMDAFYRGELKVGLKYLPSGSSNAVGTLVVDIKQAKELPAVGGGTNPVVKLHLLPNRKSSGKRKTGVIKDNINPVWEEKFTFENVRLEELAQERVLEVSVWNHSKDGSVFIGGLRIGPSPRPAITAKHKDWMDSIGDEVTHWEAMLASPGVWMEHWHTLRTTLNPRNVDLCMSKAPIPRYTPPLEEDEAVPSTSLVRARIPLREHYTPEGSPIPPQVSNLLTLKHAGSVSSLGSMASIYSEAGGKGDYDITGEVLVGVYYKRNQLHIHVERASGLAVADSHGYSNPYVKTYLLPDKAKHTKKKTSVKKKTLDPIYNETLKYKISESELSARTLWLSVWDWDRFGRNQFLGEVRLPLSSLDLYDTADKWYYLEDKDEESGVDEMYRGQVKLSMQFSPELYSGSGREWGTLYVTVEQANEFQEPVDSFVKLHLLPDKSSKGKRKTKIIKSSIMPSWEETFSYEDVQLDELSFQRALEVTVWSHHKVSGNTFIGGLRLGPAPGSAAKHEDWMDSIGDEVIHWEDVLANPGRWVEQWHTLRTTMNPRNIMMSH